MAMLLKIAERLSKLAPRLQDNEEAVMEQLRLMAACGDLASVLQCPSITQYAFELSLPGVGRADLVLFHDDGGVTLVEAKGPMDTRSLACGIGQLFVYAGAIQRMRFGGRVPTSVGMFLVAPVTAEKSEGVRRACELAGIGFLRLPPFKQFKFLLMDAMRMSHA